MTIQTLSSNLPFLEIIVLIYLRHSRAADITKAAILNGKRLLKDMNIAELSAVQIVHGWDDIEGVAQQMSVSTSFLTVLNRLHGYTLLLKKLDASKVISSDRKKNSEILTNHYGTCLR